MKFLLALSILVSAQAFAGETVIKYIIKQKNFKLVDQSTSGQKCKEIISVIKHQDYEGKAIDLGTYFNVNISDINKGKKTLGISTKEAIAGRNYFESYMRTETDKVTTQIWKNKTGFVINETREGSFEHGTMICQYEAI